MELIWHTYTCSVRGAAHVRAGRPNQDSASADPERGQGKCAIISVADGHGSSEYLRSQIGSAFAVNVTIGVLTEYLLKPEQPRLVDKHPDLRLHKQLALERVPPQIEKRWRALVEDHIQNNPLTDAEQQKLDELPPTARENIPSLASLYGTTVLGVIATQDYVLYVQNGDGDILILQEDGTVRRAVSADSRLFANETTSIASKNSWQDFRVALEPTGNKPPLLILAATDGYANSFGVDEDFLRVPEDLFSALAERGADRTLAQVPRWLDETSSGGSSDDISIGMIWRTGLPSKGASPHLRAEDATRELEKES